MTTISAETLRLADKAVQLRPHNPLALLELAAQHRLGGRLNEATRLYRTVTKLDGTSITALTGLTAVQMAQTGITEQVSYYKI